MESIVFTRTRQGQASGCSIGCAYTTSAKHRHLHGPLEPIDNEHSLYIWACDRGWMKCNESLLAVLSVHGELWGEAMSTSRVSLAPPIGYAE